jgi:hypothetical protein
METPLNLFSISCLLKTKLSKVLTNSPIAKLPNSVLIIPSEIEVLGFKLINSYDNALVQINELNIEVVRTTAFN